MQIGVGLPSFASETHAIPPDRFRRYARQADEYGFAGGWLIEHLRENPNYDTSLLDPLSTLSYVAGETETMPVGTSVMLLPLRSPVMAAKRAVTIQQLSSRQLTLGLGTGYVQSEFDAVGVPMDERSERYLEGIELMRRLFHEDAVTFDGEYYSVEDLRLEPSLGQPPRILAGGGGVDTEDGRRVLRTVKRRLLHADGWISVPNDPAIIEQDWERFSLFLDEKGRDPADYDKVGLQYLHLVRDEDPESARQKQYKAFEHVVGDDRSVEDASEMWLTGTIEEVKETLAGYDRLGFDQVILHPLATEPGELDHQLDLYRDHILPEYH